MAKKSLPSMYSVNLRKTKAEKVKAELAVATVTVARIVQVAQATAERKHLMV